MAALVATLLLCFNMDVMPDEPPVPPPMPKVEVVSLPPPQPKVPLPRARPPQYYYYGGLKVPVFP